MDDFDYWRLCDELSIMQAAHLIIGVSPTIQDELYALGADFVGESAANYRRDCEAVTTALKNAAMSGSLPCRNLEIKRELVDVHDNLDGTEDVHVGDTGSVDADDTTILVSDLRNWLQQRGKKPDFFFPDDDQLRRPDYLDPSHPRYAPKLAAAINAWIATNNESLLAGKTPKKALEKWLREHAAEFNLSDDEGKPNELGIEECAKVANWQSKGGAPKTPS